jgi:hypothetical protein
MRRHSRLWATLTCFAFAAVLGGCASVDPSGEGAVSANLEIEEMQNRVVLLNIARTSMRRPPVYTTLSSVSGKVRPTGGLTLAIPFGPNLAGGGTGTATLSAQANDAPTVSLTPLDTQEFYQGIMNPVKKETIDFYVQQGFSRALLFNLFISRIEIESADGKKIDVYRNYPTNDADMIAFQNTLNLLINEGLTTESISSKATAYGPLRTADEVRALGPVASAAKSELVITEVAPCAITLSEWGELIASRKASIAPSVAATPEQTRLEVAHKSLDDICKEAAKQEKPVALQVVAQHFLGIPATLYRVEKPGGKSSARFCMADSSKGGLRCTKKPKSAASDESNDVAVASSALNKRLPPPSEAPPPEAPPREAPPPSNPGSDKKGEKNKPQEPERKDKVLLVLRSTDGVLYYLGEVVRRQLDPDYIVCPKTGSQPEACLNPSPDAPPGMYQPDPRSVAYQYQRDSQLPTQSCWDPENPKEARCVPILTVREGDTFDAFVSVNYDGRTYAVPATRDGRDRSSQVFAIVAQLLALHKSAKDTPQSSILQVINP